MIGRAGSVWRYSNSILERILEVEGITGISLNASGNESQKECVKILKIFRRNAGKNLMGIFFLEKLLAAFAVKFMKNPWRNFWMYY